MIKILARVTRNKFPCEISFPANAWKAFETFRRPANMSIQGFLNEFDKRLYKTKSYGTVQLGDILAYRLLKSANLSNNHEELKELPLTSLLLSKSKKKIKIDRLIGLY